MYELIQAGEDTFYIDCPSKIGVYRMPGGKAMLIDSGNDKEAAKKILKILDANGWILETVINTHSNADHIGGNRLLAERTGCKIYTTRLEGAFCEFPVLEASFLYGGKPVKQLRNKFIMAEACRTGDITELRLPPGMEYFPLAGHFFDMIGIKTPDDVYFMADCVSSEAILEKYHISYIYDVAAFLETLDRISTLKGRLFVPSHTAAVKSMAPLADANRRKIFEIIEEIVRICETPRSFEEILAALFDRYGLEMTFNQYALVGSTVKSYLCFLQERQTLRAEFRGNRLLWRC